jgi:hypothetical protein
MSKIHKFTETKIELISLGKGVRVDKIGSGFLG